MEKSEIENKKMELVDHICKVRNNMDIQKALLEVEFLFIFVSLYTGISDIDKIVDDKTKIFMQFLYLNIPENLFKSGSDKSIDYVMNNYFDFIIFSYDKKPDMSVLNRVPYVMGMTTAKSFYDNQLDKIWKEEIDGVSFNDVFLLMSDQAKTSFIFELYKKRVENKNPDKSIKSQKFLNNLEAGISSYISNYSKSKQKKK